MAVFRPRCEYLEKENTVDINDFAEAIRRTEGYRSDKVLELAREQELLVRRIRKLKDQKKAYLRQIAVLSQQEDPEGTMPVDYLNNFDIPEPSMASDATQNRKDMLRNPTDAFLNYIRDNFRKFIPEIDKKLRDFDYRMLKLSLREQKLREDIDMINRRESAPKETSYR